MSGSTKSKSSKPGWRHDNTISLWQRVNIIVRRDGKCSEFVSRVEDIRQDCLALEMPIKQSGDLNLQKGDQVEINYSRKDGAYSFRASILDLFSEDGRAVTAAPVSDVQRVQRRKFVRLDISGEMTFRELAGGTGTEVLLGMEMTGTLLNISAGGVLFESPLPLKNRSLVVVSFSLKGRRSLKNILAAVKRIDGSREKGYLVGAEFLTRANLGEYGLERISKFLPPGTGTFDENLQKLVIQFIYAQQIEMRRKNISGK